MTIYLCVASSSYTHALLPSTSTSTTVFLQARSLVCYLLLNKPIVKDHKTNNINGDR